MAKTGRPPIHEEGTEQFSIRLPRGQHAELKEFAQLSEESLSGLITRVLGEWIENHEKKEEVRKIIKTRQDAAKSSKPEAKKKTK